MNVAQTETQQRTEVVIVDEVNLRSMFALSEDVYNYLLSQGMPRIQIPWQAEGGTSGKIVGTHYLFDQLEVYKWLVSRYHIEGA